MAEALFSPGPGFVGPAGPAGPAGPPGAGSGGDFTQTFTASGTVTLGNTRILVNSASATTITIPDGTTTADMTICNFGSGTCTVTGKIGGATNSVILQGSPAMSALSVTWSPTLSTYVVL